MSDASTGPSGIHPLESALPAGPLSPGGVAKLWEWLRAQRRASAWGFRVNQADIRATMRPLCDEARARGGRVEQMIVLLKQLWAMLPPETRGSQLADGGMIGWWDGGREVRDVIVRLCIDEFYSPVPAADVRGHGGALRGGLPAPNGAG